MSMRRFATIAILLAAAATALLLSGGCRRAGGLHSTVAAAAEADATNAVVYVNPGATAPALPLYALADFRKKDAQFRLEIRHWDSPVLLNSLLLSGNGDFWLASVDTIARAHAHGAPVQLLMVTGWRKFHLLSARPGDSFPQDFAGRTLPYAPPGSPGKELLESHLKDAGLPQPDWLPQENRQLLLKLLDGQYDCALLPEPLATILENRSPRFHRLFAEEEYLARSSGAPARLPWAAIAVNSDFAKANPGMVAALADDIAAAAAVLADTPAEASATILAEAVGLPTEALAKSLKHDLILALPAWEVRDELREFLSRTASDLQWDDRLCWSAPDSSSTGKQPQKNLQNMQI